MRLRSLRSCRKVGAAIRTNEKVKDWWASFGVSFLRPPEMHRQSNAAGHADQREQDSERGEACTVYTTT